MKKTIYTGLNIFQVIGVDSAETDKDKNGRDYLRLKIAVSSSKVNNFITFFLYKEPLDSKSGKRRYVNAAGDISKFVSSVSELEKLDKFKDMRGIVPLSQGSEPYLKFLKQLTGYNYKDEKFKHFMEACEKNNLLPAQLFESIEDLDKFIRKSKKDMVLLCSVNKTSRGGYFQNVENWFYGYLDGDKISDSTYDYLTELTEEEKTRDYKSTTNIYTVEFTEYGKKEKKESPIEEKKELPILEEDDLPF